MPLLQVYKGGQKWNGGPASPAAIKRDRIMESGSLASLSFQIGPDLSSSRERNDRAVWG